MLTVKELTRAIKNAKIIFIEWNGKVRPIDPTDNFEMDVYGDYVVGSIYICEDQNVELAVEMRPVRATEA